MRDVIPGCVALLVGCLLLLFHKASARRAMQDQNRLWGFHFGEREVRISQVISIIVGAGFAILGLLAILGIVHFR
jgi:hypothetical protein